jgi:hypothetical protein
MPARRSAEHVIKPAIDAFNKAANGEMVIELYYRRSARAARRAVPRRAARNHRRRAERRRLDAAPVDVSVFGGVLPVRLALQPRRAGAVHWYGLKEIWEEAYAEVGGVTWLSAGAWDPCNFGHQADPLLADLQGLRVYMFPTGGQFMQQFGVVPVTLPYEDVEVAVQTGELDGVAWSASPRTTRSAGPTSPTTT